MSSRFHCVWLFETLLTIACQAPLSMGFSRQEYWSGLPCPPPGDLPNPGIKLTSPVSPALPVDSSHTEPPRKSSFSVGKAKYIKPNSPEPVILLCTHCSPSVSYRTLPFGSGAGVCISHFFLVASLQPQKQAPGQSVVSHSSAAPPWAWGTDGSTAGTGSERRTRDSGVREGQTVPWAPTARGLGGLRTRILYSWDLCY